MSRIFVVRSSKGKYIDQFIAGNYVAIGWLPETNLLDIKTMDELYIQLMYPAREGNTYSLSSKATQINRFMHELAVNDFVITPTSDLDYMHYGIIRSEYYHSTEGLDDCPFRHRREVEWKGTIRRDGLSESDRKSFHSRISIFQLNPSEHLLQLLKA